MQIPITQELITECETYRDLVARNGLPEGEPFFARGFNCLLARAICNALGVDYHDKRIFVSKDSVELDINWGDPMAGACLEVDNPPEVAAIVTAFDRHTLIEPTILELPIDDWKELL